MKAVGQRRGVLALVLVGAVAAALVIAYLALGGGSYKPLAVADPCRPRPLVPAEGFEEVSQQILLSGRDGAACELRVAREDLVLGLAGEEARERFVREHGIGEEAMEAAIRQGLQRAVADAERAGRLSEVQASVLRTAAQALPIGTLIDAFRTGRGLAGSIGDFLRP